MNQVSGVKILSNSSLVMSLLIAIFPIMKYNGVVHLLSVLDLFIRMQIRTAYLGQSRPLDSSPKAAMSIVLQGDHRNSDCNEDNISA